MTSGSRSSQSCQTCSPGRKSLVTSAPASVSSATNRRLPSTRPGASSVPVLTCSRGRAGPSAAATSAKRSSAGPIVSPKMRWKRSMRSGRRTARRGRGPPTATPRRRTARGRSGPASWRRSRPSRGRRRRCPPGAGRPGRSSGRPVGARRRRSRSSGRHCARWRRSCGRRPASPPRGRRPRRTARPRCSAATPCGRRRARAAGRARGSQCVGRRPPRRRSAPRSAAGARRSSSSRPRGRRRRSHRSPGPCAQPCRCPSRCKVGITGSPFDICCTDQGSSAREARCRSRAASSGSRPTTSPPRTSVDEQRAVVAVVVGRLADADDLGLRDAVGVEPAQRVLAPADRDLVGAALGHRHHLAVVALAGDQLVDEAARRCAAAGDQLGADAVAVDRGRGERGDGVLVEVAGHHDPGLRRAELVELGTHLVGEHAEVAGVEAYGAEARAGDLDAGADGLVDVVGVDEQGRARRPAT